MSAPRARRHAAGARKPDGYRCSGALVDLEHSKPTSSSIARPRSPWIIRADRAHLRRPTILVVRARARGRLGIHRERRAYEPDSYSSPACTHPPQGDGASVATAGSRCVTSRTPAPCPRSAILGATATRSRRDRRGSSADQAVKLRALAGGVLRAWPRSPTCEFKARYSDPESTLGRFLAPGHPSRRAKLPTHARRRRRSHVKAALTRSRPRPFKQVYEFRIFERRPASREGVRRWGRSRQVGVDFSDWRS